MLPPLPPGLEPARITELRDYASKRGSYLQVIQLSAPVQPITFLSSWQPAASGVTARAATTICAKPMMTANLMTAHVRLLSMLLIWSVNSRERSSANCSRGAMPGSYCDHFGHCRSFQITSVHLPLTFNGGRITVLDRPRLETLSCECYAVVKTETDRLLPLQSQAEPGPLPAISA